MRGGVFYIYHWFLNYYQDQIPKVHFEEQRWAENLLSEAEYELLGYSPKEVSPLYYNFRKAINKPIKRE